jgi:hypothetical protein
VEEEVKTTILVVTGYEVTDVSAVSVVNDMPDMVDMIAFRMEGHLNSEEGVQAEHNGHPFVMEFVMDHSLAHRLWGHYTACLLHQCQGKGRLNEKDMPSHPG